ncbi:MAG: hypothetical protein HC834_00860 [Rhodospirillales bacterium]|nr:hypothetical protein [Rhodospirillales bacterium]
MPRAAVLKIRLSPPIQRFAILTLPDRMVKIALHDSEPNDRVINFTDSGSRLDPDVRNEKRRRVCGDGTALRGMTERVSGHEKIGRAIDRGQLNGGPFSLEGFTV